MGAARALARRAVPAAAQLPAAAAQDALGRERRSPARHGMMPDGRLRARSSSPTRAVALPGDASVCRAAPVPPTAAKLQAALPESQRAVGVDEQRATATGTRCSTPTAASTATASPATRATATTTARARCSTGTASRARCGTGGGTRSTSTPPPRPRAVAARPYSLATRDGDTPLKEYYWRDAGRRRRRAARAPASTGRTGTPADVRAAAELAHLRDGQRRARRRALPDRRRPGEPVVRARPPRGLPPARRSAPRRRRRVACRSSPTGSTTTWRRTPSTRSTCTSAGPTGMSFDARVHRQPRLAEPHAAAQQGVPARARLSAPISNAGKAIPLAKWNNRPPGGVRRPGLLEGYKADNDALGFFLTALRAGRTGRLAPNANATTINVLLGDFLGVAGVVRNAQRSPQPAGVRVEVFSNMIVDDSEFAFSDSRASGGGWRAAGGRHPLADHPLPERVGAHPDRRRAARRCRTPASTRRSCNWWADVQPATLDNRRPSTRRCRNGRRHALRPADLHAVAEQAHVAQRVAEVPRHRRVRRDPELADRALAAPHARSRAACRRAASPPSSRRLARRRPHQVPGAPAIEGLRAALAGLPPVAQGRWL